MKIAISAEGKKIDSLIDLRFGRCEYFQIHDITTGEVKIIENEGKKVGGGAGIAAAKQLVNENIDLIVTGNLGPNAFEIIEKAQVKAYKCECVSINNALEKLQNKELIEITMAGPSHGGMH